MTTVVVRGGLPDYEHDLGRGRVGQIGIRLGDRVPHQHRVTIADSRIAHVEETVGGVVGVESQPQETTLVAGGDQRAQIQKRSRQQGAVVQNADLAQFLNDKQPPRAVAGVGHQDRVGETGGDRLELDLEALADEARASRHREENDKQKIRDRRTATFQHIRPRSPSLSPAEVEIDADETDEQDRRQGEQLGLAHTGQQVLADGALVGHLG